MRFAGQAPPAKNHAFCPSRVRPRVQNRNQARSPKAAQPTFSQWYYGKTAMAPLSSLSLTLVAARRNRSRMASQISPSGTS